MSEYNLKIVVSAVAKNKEALEKAKQDVEGIGKASGTASAELRKMAADWAGNILGAATFVEAGKAVINMLKASVVAFAESELAAAKRDAQFEAANGATRTSIALLDSYAAALSNVTAVDDEIIVAQQEVLLQFRSISGDAIPKALRAAIDMAGGFRGNVIGSTESLGRSLELVAQGGDNAQTALSLLRKQGVILDQATKDQILSLAAAGRAEEAQIALLNAISDIMGGKAAAAADTLAGKWEVTKNAAENLGEQIGSNLAPEIERQLTWINQSIAGWTNYLQVVQRARDAVSASGRAWWELTNAERELAVQQARHVQQAPAEVQAHENNTTAIDEEIQKTRDLTLAKALLSAGMAGELQAAFKQYEIDLKNAKIAQDQAVTGMMALDEQGISPTTDAYQAQTDALNAANARIVQVNANLQRQIALMIYNNAAAHLDARGQLELARAMGLLSEQDYQVAVSIEDLTKKYDTNQDGVVDNTEAVGEYVKELDKMRRLLLNMPPEVNTTVTTTYVTVGEPPGGTTDGGGGGDPLCFLAGTPILMAGGKPRPIECVRVGERVMTWDFAENALVESTVTEFHHHEAARTSGYLVVNGKIKVTKNHPMLSAGAWKEAGKLHVGDVLDTPDGEPVIVTSLTYIEGHVETFNLHVDHADHNYIAHGVIVHNKLAAGGDFIVPDGYLNDSFPVTVQSGERVIVIPRDEVAQSYASGIGGAPSVPSVSGAGVQINTLIVNYSDNNFEELLSQIQMSHSNAGGF